MPELAKLTRGELAFILDVLLHCEDRLHVACADDVDHTNLDDAKILIGDHIAELDAKAKTQEE